MSNEQGRENLSPNIRNIIDTYHQGISYEQMKPGQLLTVHAIDASSKGSSFFLVEVL